MQRQLRKIVGKDEQGREVLECGHVQWPRRNEWGYGVSQAERRECDTCHDEEAEREGQKIASFGGPRLIP